MVNLKKPRTPCLSCGKEPKCFGYKYCSNSCQQKYQYKKSVEKWKAGEEKGLMNTGVVSGYVKRYLREKFNNKCCLCGWQEVNPKTRLVPLVADHIDGNWRNNKEFNLRLLCPNCDSLSSTYAALNKGNGRKHRVVSKRVKEARVLINKP
ncbi:MAG: HNH endonuclease [Candidatus Pacebacteria bacterium]|nr:HNH endonuclease [Candidatus Paceibacterota bacterium]